MQSVAINQTNGTARAVPVGTPTDSVALVRPITGCNLPAETFRLAFASGVAEGFKILHDGEAAAVCVRPLLTPDECDIINNNFIHNRALRSRADDVPGRTVGADLYGKPADQYIAQTQANKASVSALFAGAPSVPDLIRAGVRAALGEEVQVRRANHAGLDFNDCRGVRWTNPGTHALKFHDDLAQLKHPEQAELETSRIVWPYAFNTYSSVTEHGGELVLYNCIPDVKSKRARGIEYSGYPYEAEDLKDFGEPLVIRPQAGDLVMVPGALVHGVRGVSGGGIRILLNIFGGFVERNVFVTWS
jgi:hypothetical protein